MGGLDYQNDEVVESVEPLEEDSEKVSDKIEEEKDSDSDKSEESSE